MAGRLWRAWRRTVRAAVAASELVVSTAGHGIHKLLESRLSQEQLNSGPVGPLEVFVFPTFEESAIDSQYTSEIDCVMHGREFF